jgi:hypothetical protein
MCPRRWPDGTKIDANGPGSRRTFDATEKSIMLPEKALAVADQITVALRQGTEPAFYVFVLVFTAIFCGVVLPAVWSAKPSRRRAAMLVLDLILHTIRRRRAP